MTGSDRLNKLIKKKNQVSKLMRKLGVVQWYRGTVARKVHLKVNIYCFYSMAGSANGQDEAKFFGVIFWPYSKSFIDQACSVKMAVH